MPYPLYTVEQLPPSAAAAMQEFVDRYVAALASDRPDNWVSRFGVIEPSNSVHARYPIVTLGLKYQKTMGQSQFKTLGEKYFEIKAEEFDEGIESPLIELMTQLFSYRMWQRGPDQLLAAEDRHVLSNVAALIEAGTSTACYDGSYFFATDHPADPNKPAANTWSNYNNSGLDPASIANIQAEVASMQAVKDMNARVLGVMPDTILVPTAKFEPVKNLLKKEMIAGSGTESESNPYQGAFNVVPIPDFSDANDWYLVDSRLCAQLPPWAVLRFAADQALGLREFGTDSDFFKETSRIKISSHIWYGFGLGFPHAIRKVAGA